MISTFDQIAPLYANIMDEATKRLQLIDDALKPEIASAMDHVAVTDLCALQFRKVFEAIALACLTAHGDKVGNRLRSDTYRADKLFVGLERLNPNFYPHPCDIFSRKDELLFADLPKGTWLTKVELKRHYIYFDNFMHVKSLSRRSRHATVIELDSLKGILDRTLALVRNHYISLSGDMERLVCEIDDAGRVSLTPTRFEWIPD